MCPQVHSFDRTADETISWVNEKSAVVCSEEYGHDLESIQSLIRRHAVFENDLKPVEAKVTEVKSEADRLRSLFQVTKHIAYSFIRCCGTNGSAQLESRVFMLMQRLISLGRQ